MDISAVDHDKPLVCNYVKLKSEPQNRKMSNPPPADCK